MCKHQTFNFEATDDLPRANADDGQLMHVEGTAVDKGSTSSLERGQSDSGDVGHWAEEMRGV
jgi:hypothetical protein